MTARASAKGQIAEIIVENGPDPAQTGWWDGLASRTVLELSSKGAPESVRVGMKGEPMTTYYGDPGPAGGFPAPSYGAGNAFAKLNADQALPSTSGPAANPSSLQALLGQFQ